MRAGPHLRNRGRIMTLEPAVREPLIEAIPKLRAFAISLCRNTEEAEDLVQGALLLACRKDASLGRAAAVSLAIQGRADMTNQIVFAERLYQVTNDSCPERTRPNAVVRIGRDQDRRDALG